MLCDKTFVTQSELSFVNFCSSFVFFFILSFILSFIHKKKEIVKKIIKLCVRQSFSFMLLFPLRNVNLVGEIE